VGVQKESVGAKRNLPVRSLNGWFYDCGHAEKAFVEGCRLY